MGPDMKHAYINWGGRWLSTDADGAAALVAAATAELRRIAPDKLESVSGELVDAREPEQPDMAFVRSLIRAEIDDLVERGVLLRKGNMLVVATEKEDGGHPRIRSRVASKARRQKR